MPVTSPVVTAREAFLVALDASTGRKPRSIIPMSVTERPGNRIAQGGGARRNLARAGTDNLRAGGWMDRFPRILRIRRDVCRKKAHNPNRRSQ